ncbi:unnamed protein product [Owenia fusiformis]|uniref:RING-type E3 ubiquitin transferase n=1 Tax=Owenia fusiformis TaxID=6347 RepID=A0A8J1U0D5_OWEFU|nr:unnamed protein product [Owenia fusiformis]CAH1787222.1 unnamed protein product [Owenia fusiformis]
MPGIVPLVPLDVGDGPVKCEEDANEASESNLNIPGKENAISMVPGGSKDNILSGAIHGSQDNTQNGAMNDGNVLNHGNDLIDCSATDQHEKPCTSKLEQETIQDPKKLGKGSTGLTLQSVNHIDPGLDSPLNKLEKFEFIGLNGISKIMDEFELAANDIVAEAILGAKKQMLAEKEEEYRAKELEMKVLRMPELATSPEMQSRFDKKIDDIIKMGKELQSYPKGANKEACFEEHADIEMESITETSKTGEESVTAAERHDGDEKVTASAVNTDESVTVSLDNTDKEPVTDFGESVSEEHITANSELITANTANLIVDDEDQSCVLELLKEIRSNIDALSKTKKNKALEKKESRLSLLNELLTAFNDESMTEAELVENMSKASNIESRSITMNPNVKEFTPRAFSPLQKSFQPIGTPPRPYSNNSSLNAFSPEFKPRNIGTPLTQSPAHTQTDRLDLVTVATNTKKTKHADCAQQVEMQETREVMINTVECLFDGTSDFHIPIIKTKDKGVHAKPNTNDKVTCTRKEMSSDVGSNTESGFVECLAEFAEMKERALNAEVKVLTLMSHFCQDTMIQMYYEQHYKHQRHRQLFSASSPAEVALDAEYTSMLAQIQGNINDIQQSYKESLAKLMSGSTLSDLADVTDKWTSRFQLDQFLNSSSIVPEFLPPTNVPVSTSIPYVFSQVDNEITCSKPINSMQGAHDTDLRPSAFRPRHKSAASILAELQTQNASLPADASSTTGSVNTDTSQGATTQVPSNGGFKKTLRRPRVRLDSERSEASQQSAAASSVTVKSSSEALSPSKLPPGLGLDIQSPERKETKRRVLRPAKTKKSVYTAGKRKPSDSNEQYSAIGSMEPAVSSTSTTGSQLLPESLPQSLALGQGDPGQTKQTTNAMPDTVSFANSGQPIDDNALLEQQMFEQQQVLQEQLQMQLLLQQLGSENSQQQLDMESIDPMLQQAVMLQLLQLNPSLAANPQLLQVLIIQQLMAIQVQQQSIEPPAETTTAALPTAALNQPHAVGHPEQEVKQANSGAIKEGMGSAAEGILSNQQENLLSALELPSPSVESQESYHSASSQPTSQATTSHTATLSQGTLLTRETSMVNKAAIQSAPVQRESTSNVIAQVEATPGLDSITTTQITKPLPIPSNQSKVSLLEHESHNVQTITTSKATSHTNDLPQSSISIDLARRPEKPSECYVPDEEFAVVKRSKRSKSSSLSLSDSTQRDRESTPENWWDTKDSSEDLANSLKGHWKSGPSFSESLGSRSNSPALGESPRDAWSVKKDYTTQFAAPPVEQANFRKPLPIVASSINSVKPNKQTSKTAPLISARALSGQNTPSPTLGLPSEKPEKTMPSIKKQDSKDSNYGLDDFQEVKVARKPESSENVEDNKSDIWTQVSKKKKPTGGTSDTVAKIYTTSKNKSSNFERLVSKLMENFSIARADAINLISEVRAQHGSLSGVSMNQILKDAGTCMKQMNAAKSGEGLVYTAEDFKNMKYKTLMCQAWQQTGVCKKRDDCIFAHGKTELRKLPKTQMCNNTTFFKTGRCPYGASCVFAHSSDELQPLMQAVPMTTPQQPAVQQTTNPNNANYAAIVKPKVIKTSNAFGALDDNESDSDGEECAICYCNMKEGHENTLDCGHVFHDECIKKWVLGEERTCPLCRKLTLFPDEFPKLGK